MIREAWEAVNALTYFAMLPFGAIIPAIFMCAGFCFGLYHLVRSYPYLYYYYIEHGEIVWWTDNTSTRNKMKEVIKKHRLSDTFYPYGYVGTFFGLVAWTILFTLVGTIWPITFTIGVLFIPNLAIRYFAKGRRKKAIFEQALKEEKA